MTRKRGSLNSCVLGLALSAALWIARAGAALPTSVIPEMPPQCSGGGPAGNGGGAGAGGGTAGGTGGGSAGHGGGGTAGSTWGGGGGAGGRGSGANRRRRRQRRWPIDAGADGCATPAGAPGQSCGCGSCAGSASCVTTCAMGGGTRAVCVAPVAQVGNCTCAAFLDDHCTGGTSSCVPPPATARACASRPQSARSCAGAPTEPALLVLKLGR